MSFAVKQTVTIPLRRIHTIVLVLVLVFQTVDAYGVDRLVGLHSAIAVTQSLPAIAREAGVFKKNNLDFELVFIQSSGAGTAAMLGGDAEIGILGAVGVLRAYLQGAADFKEFALMVLAKFLRINDRKILESTYDLEIPAVEQRLDLKAESIQAVLEEIAPSDSRAKDVKPQQLIDRKYLDEMDKSGFYESLWDRRVRGKG